MIWSLRIIIVIFFYPTNMVGHENVQYNRNDPWGNSWCFHIKASMFQLTSQDWKSQMQRLEQNELLICQTEVKLVLFLHPVSCKHAALKGSQLD